MARSTSAQRWVRPRIRWLVRHQGMTRDAAVYQAFGELRSGELYREMLSSGQLRSERLGSLGVSAGVIGAVSRALRGRPKTATRKRRGILGRVR